MQAKNLVGQKFNKLTVIERCGKTKNRHANWICVCDCGNTAIVVASTDNLISGNHKSCGCLKKLNCIKGGLTKRKRPFESAYNSLIRNAKKRAINVFLTYEEFIEFTKIEECHYCLCKLIWEPHNSKSIKINLDRKDNNEYSKENCVTCCKRCNQAKSNVFTYEEWYEMTECLRRKNDSI
jgi:hypothetical protein